MTLRERVDAIQADITSLAFDAIVNAANAQLMPGGGVDGAIRYKAGPKLNAELYKRRYCAPGEALITPGYDLPARHVIHTVAPFFDPGARLDEQEDVFRRCYMNVLNLADENKIGTIAFPAIGTGAYGWPPDRAAALAFSEVMIHLRNSSKQARVTFCCFNKADLQRYETLFSGLVE